jgi:WD40 repeat protein
MCLLWNTSGNRLYSGARDHSIKVWDTTALVELREVADSGSRMEGQHKGDVTRIVFCPAAGVDTDSSATAVSCGMDGDIRMWRLVSGRVRALRRVENRRTRVGAVCVVDL